MSKSKQRTIGIEIIGEIGLDVDSRGVRRQVKSASKGDSIAVDLHSHGGSVFESYLIHNTLKAHPGPVSVTILGLAASAGSWIPLAADKGSLFIHNLAQIMAHESRSMAFGTASLMEKQAVLLRKLDSQLAGLYSERTGIDKDEFLSLMESETWWSSEEALDVGLVDKILEKDPISNRFDLSSFKNVPKSVEEFFGALSRPDPLVKEIENALREVKDLECRDHLKSNLDIDQLETILQGENDG